MRLSALLRDYDIRSANIRFGEPIGQVKGYYRADFADAWARYCTGSPGESSQRSQPSQPSSDLGRPSGRDGSSRPRGHDGNDQRDGSSRPAKTAVPGLTSSGTIGTAGTTTPRLRGIDGGAA